MGVKKSHWWLRSVSFLYINYQVILCDLFIPKRWRSLSPLKGHLTIPKRSQRITRYKWLRFCLCFFVFSLPSFFSVGFYVSGGTTRLKLIQDFKNLLKGDVLLRKDATGWCVWCPGNEIATAVNYQTMRGGNLRKLENSI